MRTFATQLENNCIKITSFVEEGSKGCLSQQAVVRNTISDKPTQHHRYHQHQQYQREYCEKFAGSEEAISSCIVDLIFPLLRYVMWLTASSFLSFYHPLPLPLPLPTICAGLLYSYPSSPSSHLTNQSPHSIWYTHPLRATNIHLIVITRTPAFFCCISITHSCYLYRLNPLIDSSSSTLQHPWLHLEKGICPMTLQRTVNKHSTAQHRLSSSLFFAFPFSWFFPSTQDSSPPPENRLFHRHTIAFLSVALVGNQDIFNTNSSLGRIAKLID